MNREATQNHRFSTSLPCSDHVQALGLSSKPEMIMEDIMSGALKASLRATENDKGQGCFFEVKSMVIYLRCNTLCWCEQWSTVLYCLLFWHFTSCLLTLELNFSTNLQRCSPLMASRFSHKRFRFMNLLKLAVSIFHLPKMTLAETLPKRSINQTTFHLRVHFVFVLQVVE